MTSNQEQLKNLWGSSEQTTEFGTTTTKATIEESQLQDGLDSLDLDFSPADAELEQAPRETAVAQPSQRTAAVAATSESIGWLARVRGVLRRWLGAD